MLKLCNRSTFLRFVVSCHAAVDVVELEQMLRSSDVHAVVYVTWILERGVHLLIYHSWLFFLFLLLFQSHLSPSHLHGSGVVLTRRANVIAKTEAYTVPSAPSTSDRSTYGNGIMVYDECAVRMGKCSVRVFEIRALFRVAWCNLFLTTGKSGTQHLWKSSVPARRGPRWNIERAAEW